MVLYKYSDGYFLVSPFFFYHHQHPHHQHNNTLSSLDISSSPHNDSSSLKSLDLLHTASTPHSNNGFQTHTIPHLLPYSEELGPRATSLRTQHLKPATAQTRQLNPHAPHHPHRNRLHPLLCVRPHIPSTPHTPNDTTDTPHSTVLGWPWMAAAALQKTGI